MLGHFDCVGFSVDPSEFGLLCMRLAREARADRGDSDSPVVWTDAKSGARMVFHFDDAGEIACINPSFATQNQLTAYPGDLDVHEDCSRCVRILLDVIDETGTEAYPAVVHLEDRAIVGALDGTAVLASITGFATSIEAWNEEQSDQFDDPVVTPNCFIPAGELGEVPVLEPRANICGQITEARTLLNSQTGRSFHHLTLSVLGTRFDVVTAAYRLPELPPAGWTVRADCWLVGNIDKRPTLMSSLKRKLWRPGGSPEKFKS